MTIIKKLVGYLIFFAVVFLIIKYSNRYGNNQTAKFYNELSFSGVISKKYINKKQHNYPILEVMKSDNKIQEINLSTDNSGLFEYVQKKDSVVKMRGSLDVHVFKNSIDKVFTLTWSNY
jgi:hypothetical protein